MKKIFFILLFIILISSLSCSDYSDLKYQYLAEKQFYKANKLMNNININPRVVSTDDYTEAVSKFRNIIDTYGDAQNRSERIKNILENSWMKIAQLYFYQGKFPEANKTYEDVISLNFSNKALCASAQFSKARIFEQTNKLDTALVEYETFFRDYQNLLKEKDTSNPSYLETPIKIARLYRVLGNNDFNLKYEEAREFYLELASSRPDTQMVSQIYHFLATTYADLQDWRSSIVTLRTLITEYPDTTNEPFILYEIASIYKVQLQQLENALNELKYISNKYPFHPLNANVHLSMGDIYFLNQDYSEARNQYNEVVKNAKDNIAICSRAQFGVGVTYEKQDEWEKAENELNWVWSNYPLTGEALIVPNYIANYYKKINLTNLAVKSFEEAINKYEQFYDHYSKNDLAPMSLLQMSISYVNLEKWEESVEILEKILGNHSNSNVIPDVYLRLGTIFTEKIVQKDKAIQFYEVFLDRFSRHPAVDQVKQKIAALKE